MNSDLNFNEPKTVLITGPGSTWLSMILAAVIGSEKSFSIGPWESLTQTPAQFVYTSPNPKTPYVRPVYRDGLHGNYLPREITPPFHAPLSIPQKLNGLFKGTNTSSPRLTITDYFSLGTATPTRENPYGEKRPLNLSLPASRGNFLQDIKYSLGDEPLTIFLEDYSKLFPADIDTLDLQDWLQEAKDWHISIMLTCPDIKNTPSLLKEKRGLFDSVINVNMTPSEDGESIPLAISEDGADTFDLLLAGKEEGIEIYSFTWSTPSTPESTPAIPGRKAGE